MEGSIKQGDRESGEARCRRLVPITSVPAGHNIFGTRKMFKIKASSIYKGRLVVQRFLQIPGVDCGGTFAPVYRLQSIRIVLAIATELDYNMHMLGVQTAFLDADVEEDVLVKMAPGYDTNDKGVPLVMKLNKSCAVSRRAQISGSARCTLYVRIHLRGQDWLHCSNALRERHFVPQREQAGRFPAFCLLGCQLGQQSGQRRIYVIIHRDAGQRPDQLQGGTAGTDRTVHVCQLRKRYCAQT